MTLYALGAGEVYAAFLNYKGRKATQAYLFRGAAKVMKEGKNAPAAQANSPLALKHIALKAPPAHECPWWLSSGHRGVSSRVAAV
ncbi:hypothetical protein GCM10007159_29410 [Modicisalibacter luteus]|nr:hypothetical protein GCM10007159_29410 [Halomonas lutea]